MNNNLQRGCISKVFAAKVAIRMLDAEECHGCGLKTICAHKEITVPINEINWKVRSGQLVNLSYSKVLQTSAIIYLLPLFFFFTGLAGSRWLLDGGQEVAIFFGGLLGLALGLALVRILNNRLSQKKYRFVISLAEHL